MGIGITSNLEGEIPTQLGQLFQSPMGIGITSNWMVGGLLLEFEQVSIPNGDRHYLELARRGVVLSRLDLVSIPNGDRHYLEQAYRRWRCWICHSFNPQWG